MYKIRDLQFANRYFGNGEIFNSKRDICLRLIDFHSDDCDMENEQDLFTDGKIDECLNELKYFEWEIEEAT